MHEEIIEEILIKLANHVEAPLHDLDQGATDAVAYTALAHLRMVMGRLSALQRSL